MKGLPVKTTNLTFSINENTILENINLNINSGEFVCILGPSGAGKTTLLNALSNRVHYGDLEGNIYYGGQKLSKNGERAFAFVTQEDLMLPSLTPRETLEYAGRFLMSGETTKEERDDRVAEILRMLRLNKCADTLIGGFGKKRGISGGERKRVNIGMSLVKDPQILFVDEPTSGLDSGTAVTVISVLKSLSQQGLTILCTIHQPRKQIFDMFDRLILLSSGKLVYYGPTQRSEEYFQQYGLQCPKGENIADWLIDLIEVKNVKQHKFLKEFQKHKKKKKKKTRKGSMLKTKYQNQIIPNKGRRKKKGKNTRKKKRNHHKRKKNSKEKKSKTQTKTKITKKSKSKGAHHKKKSNKNNKHNSTNSEASEASESSESSESSETSTTTEMSESISDNDKELVLFKLTETSEESDFDFESITTGRSRNSNTKNTKQKKKKGKKQRKIQTDSVGTHKFLDFLVSQYKKSSFCQKYAKSDGDKTYEISKPVKTAKEFSKLKALISRGFKTTIREKSKIIRVVQSVIVALFVGFVFFDVPSTQDGIRDRMGLLFFALISNTMLSLISVLFVLPKEKIIFLKESQDRAYSTKSFYLSKVIVDTPFEVLSPILFTLVLYWTAGLKSNVDTFFIFMLCVIIVGNIGSSLGFFLSAGSRTPETALSIAPATLIPILMFAGFVVDLESIPSALSWIQYLDPVSFGLGALVKNEFTDLEFSCLDKEIIQGICPLTKGEDILKYYNYEDISIFWNIIFMALFIPILRFMGYIALKISRKKEIGR
ncbi:abc transporter g family member [Anaeramoeba flamelloides]|uniref:Abc transporter g family member n=1 Tax=Anaeramoeba flamelloides TaxID=1746091 RepID=A0AAV8AHW1_9EUKA|nr:abc transporter g family member [Anaeramoeba flamelloides]